MAGGVQRSIGLYIKPAICYAPGNVPVCEHRRKYGRYNAIGGAQEGDLAAMHGVAVESNSGVYAIAHHGGVVHYQACL